DNFKGANKVIKAQILDTILEKDIQSVDALAKELEHQGFEVKIRNVGKENRYLNIKDPSKPKGINLKDTVFTERFLALPQEEKQTAAIPKPPEPQYLEPSKGNYQAGEKAHQTLAHWHKV
ncbi:relaxase, partial [Photobacterium damselae]